MELPNEPLRQSGMVAAPKLKPITAGAIDYCTLASYTTANKALHLTAFPLRSKAAGELSR